MPESFVKIFWVYHEKAVPVRHSMDPVTARLRFGHSQEKPAISLTRLTNSTSSHRPARFFR